MKIHISFAHALRVAREILLLQGKPVHSKFWQGMDVERRPEAEMLEVLNHSFQVPVGTITIPRLREELKPNLPWADVHFDQERIGGQPLNPGETWKIWPYSNSADKFRKEGEQFNHTYAERFWPKFAGYTTGGKLENGASNKDAFDLEGPPRKGIRYRYADLTDLLDQLQADPLTRQAYIPIWFPEDGSHTDRKPCTLGYHVIRRGTFMHMVYYIRSCDIVRHFQDDVYLAMRLLLWIIGEMKVRDPENWMWVSPGMFTMHITSLHCFINDQAGLMKLYRDGG